jgi:hypothetical protein
MKHLVILRPSPKADMSQLLALQLPEEREVWRLYTADVIRAMHWSGDPQNPASIKVVLELETATTAATTSAIGGLPMVAAGVLIPEIIPLGPWKPLEILFAAELVG